MHAVRRLLEAIDRGVYQAERGLLLLSLVMMTLLVFSDVIIRTFTRPVGKTASLLLWGLERLGEVSKETHASVADFWGPLIFVVLALSLCVFGAHASRHMRAEREGTPPPSLPGSVARGGAVFLGLALSVKGVVWLFPTGVAGAQKFALGFMVWAGFLGASLATRAKRHIVIDAVKKKLDDGVLPWFSFLGALATAAFMATLGYVAAFKAATLIGEWHESGGRLHVFESLPVPEWVVTLALPTTFFLIAARFFVHGVADLLYGPSLEGGADAHGVDLERLAAEAEAKSAASAADPPSGPIYGVPHRGGEGRPTKQGGAR